jgi:alpha,alpha-trehalase
MKMQIHELGRLFEVVQMENLLGDGKTFPDCVPKRSLVEIQGDYERLQNTKGFDLKKFLLENFSLPKAFATGYQSDPGKTASQHIKDLWDVLTRQPEEPEGSLITLPHPYIVPGGRFREIYYWDSYFTMLGLRVSGRVGMIENMVDNFAHLINTFGYIPNGNRTYFLGRSQPPFFSLMVRLLADEKGKQIMTKYLPSLEMEYRFWMNDAGSLSQSPGPTQRVVRMSDGSILNRYWDANDTPRPESYKEDVELAHRSKENPQVIFRHLRAAAESGWDFSSRWFRTADAFETIHTTDIIPLDLNCLLMHLEQLLAEAHDEAGNNDKSSAFKNAAERRKAGILNYCWNDKKKFFFDYDFVAGNQTDAWTLAAAFPLFFRVATGEQGKAIAVVLKQKFLMAGGLITTTLSSGQQWDAPNGWAPLQWIAYNGLLNYGEIDLSLQLKNAWTRAILKVYESTGKMTEKYNVINDSAEGGGGEYPNQDGFGWTNGVFLAMMQ